MAHASSEKKKKDGDAGRIVRKKGAAYHPTGIAELDRVLHGGFPDGATVLLAGAAGNGKTILSSQWLFAGYSSFGEKGLFISMTEYESSFIKNLRKMSFFDQDAYASKAIDFLDLRIEMANLGLEDKAVTRADITRLCEGIADKVVKNDVKRVAFDSVTAIGYRLHDPYLIRDFIFQLRGYLGTGGANVLMTTEAVGDKPGVFGGEDFIADGVIRFDRTPSRTGEPIRSLQVVKMRASSYETYPVAFSISRDGFTFFPRISQDLNYQASKQRAQSGVPGLDSMLGGGFFQGSSVLLTGAPGTGKTILSMQCVVGALVRGEQAMFVSFEESHDHLLRNAAVFGWDLEGYIRRGSLRLICHYSAERQMDELIKEIMRAIEDVGPKLMVIDSISALQQSQTDEDMRNFTSQVIAMAKAKGITSLFTAASASLLGSGEEISGTHLSTITDDIILLRYVEIQSEMRHGVLILKVRGSDHDRKLREFTFTPNGIQVLYDFRGYENVMSGGTRKVSKSTEDELQDLFTEILGPFAVRMFAEVKARGLDVGNVQALLAELGDQGIISRRRKDEFIKRADVILKRSGTDLAE